MERVRGERGAAVACARRAHDATVRATSIAITTPITSERVPARRARRVRRSRRAARSRARRSGGSRARGSSPSASAERCSALPCPYWCPVSAGRAATPTAKNVSSAAIRSVPECAASESRPRLCVARPVPSFSPIRASRGEDGEERGPPLRRHRAEAYSGDGPSGQTHDVLPPREVADRRRLEARAARSSRARSRPQRAAAATARGGSRRARARRAGRSCRGSSARRGTTRASRARRGTTAPFGR